MTVSLTRLETARLVLTKINLPAPLKLTDTLHRVCLISTKINELLESPPRVYIVQYMRAWSHGAKTITKFNISRTNELVVDYSTSHMDVAAKRTKILICGCCTHVLPSSTLDLYNQHNFNSVSDPMWNTVTISPFQSWVTVLSDGQKSVVANVITLSLYPDICVKFYYKWLMNSWVMTNNVFCEVTVTFDL